MIPQLNENATVGSDSLYSEAAKFLQVLAPGCDKFTFGYSQQGARGIQTIYDTLERAFKRLRLLNDSKHDIYVLVQQGDSSGKRRKENIVKLRAVFKEQDTESPDPPDFPPAMVVETSEGHYHKYWPHDLQSASEDAVALWDSIMRAMCTKWGSDHGAKDIARVLRLPGFVNHKPGRSEHVVRLIDVNEEYGTMSLRALAKRIGKVNGHIVPLPSRGEHHQQIASGKHVHTPIRNIIWAKLHDGEDPEGIEQHCLGEINQFPEDTADQQQKKQKALDDLPGMIRASVNKYQRTRVNGKGFKLSTQPAKKKCLVIDDNGIEAIDWLWEGWLARGKLHLLAGDAGTSKTTVAVNLAATITTGGKFPDGQVAKQSDVIMWSGEDGISDTLRPRFLAAGGDTKHMHFISGAVSSDGEHQAFDPSEDVPLIQEFVEERMGQGRTVSMLIIDPLISAIKGDGHNNKEVRNSLSKLFTFVDQHNIALIGIMHFNKGSAGMNPAQRINGSIAFNAAARVSMVMARVEGDDSLRHLAIAKSNIAKDTDGFEMEVTPVTLDEKARTRSGELKDVETIAVKWKGVITGNATKIINDAEGTEPKYGDKMPLAVIWLKRILGDGMQLGDDVKTAAASADISDRTLRRASQTAGIEKGQFRKEAGDRRYYWKLPEGSD